MRWNELNERVAKARSPSLSRRATQLHVDARDDDLIVLKNGSLVTRFFTLLLPRLSTFCLTSRKQTTHTTTSGRAREMRERLPKSSSLVHTTMGDFPINLHRQLHNRTHNVVRVRLERRNRLGARHVRLRHHELNVLRLNPSLINLTFLLGFSNRGRGTRRQQCYRGRSDADRKGGKYRCSWLHR